MLTIDTPYDAGAHHFATSSALVQAPKTMRAGPLKVRVTTISRSPSSFIVVSFFMTRSLSFLASIALLLFGELLDEPIELVEARIPEASIFLEPVVHLAERLRAQLVEPLLSARLHLDEARLLEHPQ